MRKSFLAAFLLLIAAPLAFAGWDRELPSRIGTDEQEQSSYFSEWGRSMRAADSLGEREEVFRPYTYYVDDFGAFFFDETFNRIYAAASSPKSSFVNITGASSGGGGGGGTSCWQFAFEQEGGFYPNPSNAAVGGFKADLNLLVLGTDYNFYNATISRKVTNSIGQTVVNNVIATYPSNPDFTITAWDARTGSGSQAASGHYSLTLTATSSLCGTRTISSTVTVVN